MQQMNPTPLAQIGWRSLVLSKVKGGAFGTLFSIIVEDIRTQREGLLAPGVWILILHRIDTACRAIGWRPVRYALVLPVVILKRIIEIQVGIELARYARIGRRLRIEHWGGIVIHGCAVIGDDCLIRHGVTLGNRGADNLAAPILGDRVDIGAGAKLLGKIVIGNDARIGANAVVIKNVPAGATAVGIPARILNKKAASQREK
ncbi:MAG TPA: serine acetyltransferase [Rhodocyclaceae bacterium]|nr:serine acetyltransferase [Rhodocyclaceae bacterium]